MSQENKPAVVAEPTSDFTDKDLALIEAYKEAGLPDIASVDGKKLEKILDLYLSGKTYRQISQIVSINKSIILYLSQRFNWFDLRMDYITDLEQGIRVRVLEARIVGQDFLLELIQMWQKKIGDNITKYLATDNVEFANNIDLKEVDKYLKTVEILHRLSQDPKSQGGNPAVGLNLGDGVKIEKNADGSVEITPKSKAIGAALKEFADMRRVEEKVPVKK